MCACLLFWGAGLFQQDLYGSSPTMRTVISARWFLPGIRLGMTGHHRRLAMGEISIKNSLRRVILHSIQQAGHWDRVQLMLAVLPVQVQENILPLIYLCIRSAKA